MTPKDEPMTPTLEEAQVASDAAKAALDKLDDEIRAAKVAAAHEIDSRYRASRDGLREEVSRTERELIAAKDLIPDHPWTGKRVFKVEKKYARWTSRVISEERVYGVVETRRSATPLPGNQRWDLPRLGEGFVRLLKKDGTPGGRIDKIAGFRSEWQLDDGANP